MKIPGLTFIFGPIICWLLYVYSDSIVNAYNKDPETFLIMSFVIYVISAMVELFVFRIGKYDTDKEIFENTTLLLPFILTYKLFAFLNEYLTVKI